MVNLQSAFFLQYLWDDNCCVNGGADDGDTDNEADVSSKCLFPLQHWCQPEQILILFYLQTPPPMWRSRTQTTTDHRSAPATQLRTRSRTWTTTATTTTATRTTTWTTPATTRPSTTMGGEREVFEGLLKNSEKRTWPQFMKDWLETFKPWRIIQNL